MSSIRLKGRIKEQPTGQFAIMNATATTALQQFLRRRDRNSAFETLRSPPYCLRIKPCSTHPTLYLFRYHQIRSTFSNEIVQEARGIILDSADNWKIVCYPFTKFFGLNEKHAASIDWSSARVYEKLDGSMMSLYWYNEDWRVSSSGVADASGMVDSLFNMERGKKETEKQEKQEKKTYATLFWKVWRQLGYHTPPDSTKCYVFELTSPENRIIVHHLKYNLELIFARSLVTLKEEDPEVVGKEMGWNVVTRKHNFDSVEHVRNSVKDMNPRHSEGYVICDAQYRRVKVKCPEYVRLAHVPGGQVGSLAVIRVIQNNEGEEWVSIFPHAKEQYEHWKSLYDHAVNKIAAVWEECAPLAGDRKAFSAKVVGHWYSKCVFMLRERRISSPHDFLRSLDPELLEKSLPKWKEEKVLKEGRKENSIGAGEGAKDERRKAGKVGVEKKEGNDQC